MGLLVGAIQYRLQLASLLLERAVLLDDSCHSKVKRPNPRVRKEEFRPSLLTANKTIYYKALLIPSGLQMAVLSILCLSFSPPLESEAPPPPLSKINVLGGGRPLEEIEGKTGKQ